MAEPLDFETIKHFLKREGNAPVEIAEPTGFDAAKFVIKQDDKRYGRDVEFSPSDLTFNENTDFRGLTHRFENLIYDYNAKGFEANWKYILEIDGVQYILGQLDFKTAKTDGFTYFTTNIIQENSQAIIKSREEVAVDLFATTDIDGNEIDPLATTKMYLQATPEKQDSRWEMYENYFLYSGNPGGGGAFGKTFNPFVVIKKSEVEDTLSPPVNAISPPPDGRNDFAIIEAANELTNVTLRIKGLNFRMEIDNFINNFGFATCSLIYKIGENANPGSGNPWVEIFNTGELRKNNAHDYVLENQDFTIPNLTIPRDQKLFLFFEFFLDTQNNPFTAQLWVTGGSVEVEATSTSISSVVETFNLGDAMQHVVKSISGLQTDAPRFIGENAEFKDQYITNGLLMRNITDQPFYLSLKDILGYLPEPNGDYEISDNKVFFGRYPDFYRNVKIGDLKMPPNKDFKTYFNDRYTVNKYNLKYAKYENANDEQKSREGVHTEMETVLPNKYVDNTKDVQIGFVRDTFLIESTRKEAIKVEKDVATTNDDTIFLIDVWKRETPLEVTEQFTVYHKPEGNIFLRLLCDDSFNFRFLGFKIGDVIQLEFRNAGLYTITGIEDDVLLLTRLYPFPWNDPFTGYGSVKMNYKITETLLVNRTNEFFSVILGTTTPQGFSNLRFTPKRNTNNYWSEYLATCCKYHPNGKIKVTKFVHNGKLETRLFGEAVNTVEDADIYVNKLKPALITPVLVNTTVLCDFSQFWDIRTKLRTLRGYITVSDNNGNSMDLFPSDLSFNWKENLLEITGEQKA